MKGSVTLLQYGYKNLDFNNQNCIIILLLGGAFMFEWIKDNIATLIVGSAVLVIVILAFLNYIKNSKKGGCAGCSGCAYKESCQSYKKSKKKKD